MSKSLQEQLMSLGLAREKPGAKRPRKSAGGPQGRSGKAAKAVGQPQEKSRKKSADMGGEKDSAEMSLNRAYALRKQEEQKQADLARRRKQEEVRRRRQLNREIGAIVNCQHTPPE
jgi:hypothetical protein